MEGTRSNRTNRVWSAAAILLAVAALVIALFMPRVPGPPGPTGPPGPAGNGSLMAYVQYLTPEPASTTCQQYGPSVPLELPTSGDVVVVASVGFALGHAQGTEDRLIIGLSMSANHCTTVAAIVALPSSLPDGLYVDDVIAQRIFRYTSAGPIAIHINAIMPSGLDMSDALTRHITTVTFFAD